MGAASRIADTPTVPRSFQKQAEEVIEGSMKLMIVEDDPDVCELLKQLLSDVADVIAECSDGEQAVAAFAVEQPDWTLIDLQDARLGGIEATRHIRAAWPEARIIIVTEFDDQHWRAAARQPGACGYLLKEDLLAVRRLQSNE